MKPLAHARAAALTLTLLLLLGCLPESGRTIVTRLSSPDGSFDAVVVETHGWMSSRFSYEVYIAEKDHERGKEVALLEGATRNAHADGVDVSWPDNTHLAVNYLQATAVREQESSITIAGRPILIALRSGIRDMKAPAGSMAHNLPSGKLK